MKITVSTEAELLQFYRMLIEILISLSKTQGNEKAIDDVATIYYSSQTKNGD